MKLVIVESPYKCETIAKYLGKGYTVMASVGHLDDLATSGVGGFGVDINNGFTATYVISKDKYAVVSELKRAKAKAEEVIIATDPDREGEAIAWHLMNILGLDPNTTKRLEFHEITKESIENAIANPRYINMNLVNSQETRRIMDRIIGFKLSGIIQKKIKSRSAGRVQSATLKLICDHDIEIDNFKPEEYWNLSIDLKKGANKITADYLVSKDNPKIVNKSENDKVLSKINKTVSVESVNKEILTIESKPPFTTSTLQQEAFNSLKMPTATTSKIAQLLYEGINLGNERVGLITYIRTDSVALSDGFTKSAKAFIEKKYGKEYAGHRKQAKVNMAQGAHEAIRPTSIYRTPESVKNYLPTPQYKLYKLIYERTLLSLMANKKDELTTAIFNSNGVKFKYETKSTVFDGFSVINKNENYKKSNLTLNEGEELEVVNINNEQKFTAPPAHYSEAKIVKVMEEKGIGRPSTYASTIKTIKQRGYVESSKGSIISTEQGKKTAYVLNKYFPKFIDTKYTAQMEQELDKIQEGNATKVQILTDFYFPFVKECDEAKSIMYKDQDEQIDKKCPKCGAPLVKKQSKYGTFIGCSNFPHCDYSENEETGEKCPECGRPLVYRYKKNGQKFIACSGYPTCKYTVKENKNNYKTRKYSAKKAKK